MEIMVIAVAALVGSLAGALAMRYVLKGRLDLAYQRAREEAVVEQTGLSERRKARDQEITGLQNIGRELNDKVQAMSAEADTFRTENASLRARAERIPAIEEQLTEARGRISALTDELREATGRLATAREQIRNYQEQANVLEQRETELREAREEISELKSRISTLDTTLEQERKQADEKLTLLEKARESLTQEFQNLANRIFEEKGEKLTNQNKAHLETILNPLREQLGDFRKRVEDVYDKESKDRTSLHAQIENLNKLNRQISQDAVNLTKALKGSSKTQGNWGEVVLESILEKSGLVKDGSTRYRATTRTRRANVGLPMWSFTCRKTRIS